MIQKYTEIILREMCNRVNVKYEDIDFKKARWFMQYSWTEEQQDDFALWLNDYLMDTKEARQELMNSPLGFLSYSIPPGIIFSSFSTNRVIFTLNTAPDRSFIFIEGNGLVEDLASCSLLQEQQENLFHSLVFSLEYPTASLHIASPLLRGKAALLVRQGLLKEILRRNKKTQAHLDVDKPPHTKN